jgi:lysophospholipase L1-like esterase
MRSFLKKICQTLICLFVFNFFASAQTTAAETVLKWRDARDFTVEGKGWTEAETANFYDRLPARAEKTVRPEVWRLAMNSAGISVGFVTDADSISVRWRLRSPNAALWNMTAAAVSGVDLYVRENGRWLWAGVGKPDKSSLNEQKIIANMTPRRRREFRLYLPLYNGVETVEIGLPPHAAAGKIPADEKNIKPLVFYGTSIVQGASASRAGMAYPSILGRKLNRPVVNLGFSGNGRMEVELAALLAEIDAAAYVIDCLPNLSSGAEVLEKTPKVIETLRRQRPATPIVLVENIRYPDVFIEERKSKIYREKNAALRRVYERLRAAKFKNIYYVAGENLIGNDAEATIDGVHPTDLGFVRMAEVFEPLLRSFLKTQDIARAGTRNRQKKKKYF